MSDRDYYDILGVARDATPDQIKKAYRTLARKYHPDVNPGDPSAEARFKEAQEAYEILSDREKRALYDQFGRAAFSGAGAAGPRAGAAEWFARQQGPVGGEAFDFSQFFGPGVHVEVGGAEEGFGGGIFDELLGRMRGGSRSAKRRRAPAARDLEATLKIPFLTAVKGGTATIEIARAGGDRESLSVKIPPGTRPGAKLRLRGRGLPPSEPGGLASDLLVTVEVEPHPYFTRDDRNLIVELPLTIAEAILGAKVEVPTLDGRRTLTVPPGSSSGQKLRLRGQGVPAGNNQPAGDLLVVLKVVVPKTIDEESRRLIEQFAARNPQSPRDGLW